MIENPGNNYNEIKKNIKNIVSNKDCRNLNKYFSDGKLYFFINREISFDLLKNRKIKILNKNNKTTKNDFTNAPVKSQPVKRWGPAKSYRRRSRPFFQENKIDFNKGLALSQLEQDPSFIKSSVLESHKSKFNISSKKLIPADKSLYQLKMPSKRWEFSRHRHKPLTSNKNLSSSLLQPSNPVSLKLVTPIIKPISPLKNLSFTFIKKLTHPLFTGPLEVYCNYVPGTHAGMLLMDIAGVTGTSYGIAKIAAAIFNTPTLLTIGIASIIDNFLPDFVEILKKQPTVQEMDKKNLLPHSPIQRALYVKQLGGNQVSIKVLATFQTVIKLISAHHVWDKLKLTCSHELPQKTDPLFLDEFVGPPEKSFFLTDNMTNFTEQNLHLDWTFSKSLETGNVTISTEIPFNELTLPSREEALLESDEKEHVQTKTRRPINYNLIFPEKPQAPSFKELCEIKELQLIPIGKTGVGIAATLAAYQTAISFGASASGEAIVGISVTLESGFMSALSAGCIYVIPIAIALTTANILLKKHYKSIKSTLHSHASQLEKERLQINADLENFNQILKKFNKNEIAPENIIEHVSDLIKNFATKSEQFDKKGMYADKHRASSVFYYLEKNNLLQINEDLKKIIQEIAIQSQIQTDFLPYLQTQTNCELISIQKFISTKKYLISKEETAKQACIKQEIMSRIYSLEEIEKLNELSLGLYIEPPLLHFAPKPIDRRNINSGKQGERKHAKHVMKWAQNIENSYTAFVGSLDTIENKEIILYNIKKLLKTIQTPCSQPAFKNTINSEGQVATTPQLYYQPWLTKIHNSLTSLQNQVLKCQQKDPLFTQSEIHFLKYNALLNKCMGIADQLQNDECSLEFKERLFNELKEAMPLLHSIALSLNERLPIQEMLHDIIIPTLQITQSLTSYKEYHQKIIRLTTIQDSITCFIDSYALYKNSTKEEKPALYHALTALAYDIAKLNILKTELNQTASKELYTSILSLKDDLIIKDYQVNIVPKYSYGWNFSLHLLENKNRYEGSKSIKKITKVLRDVHLLAPSIIPTIIAMPEALARGHILYQSQLLKNEWKSLVNIFVHPCNTLNAAPSFHGKLIEIQKVSDIVHVGINVLAKVDTRFTPILNKYRPLSQSIDRLAEVSSYANLLLKLKRCILEKQTFDNISSISNLCAVAGFKTYNYFSKKSNRGLQLTRWKSVNTMTNFFKNRLPDFSEYLGYHMFLDVVQLGVAGLGLYASKRSPKKTTAIAFAVYRTSIIAHKLSSGQYRDRQIEAIGTNCVHSITTNNLIDNKEFLDSLKNLELLLGNNYLIQEKDSLIKNNSRKFLFECHLKIAIETKNFSKALKLTTIEFDEKINVWKFKKLGTDIFKQFQLYQERISIIYDHFQDHMTFEDLTGILNEIDGLKKFLKNGDAENKNIEFIDNLYLNFINLYLSKKLNKAEQMDRPKMLESLQCIEKLKSMFDFDKKTTKLLDKTYHLLQELLSDTYDN